MVDLRPNLVGYWKMNDNAADPFVASLKGTPTQLVDEPYFDAKGTWDNSAPVWYYDDVGHKARYYTTNGIAGCLIQPNANFITGKKYLIVYTISGVFGTVGFTPVIRGTPGIGGSTNGRYVEVIQAGSAAAELKFYGSAPPASTGLFYLDNVFCICLDDFPNTGVFTDGGTGWTNNYSVSGKINTALSFDNISYIEVFDQGSCEFPTSDFSVGCWVKWNGSNVFDAIIDKRDSGTDGWGLYFWLDNTVRFIINGMPVISSTTIEDSDWHLIIVTVDRDGSAQIYIDNVAVGDPVDVSGLGTMSVAANLHLGHTAYTLEYGFLTGLLDCVGIVDKVLSADERDFLWRAGRGTETLAEPYYVLYRGQDGNIDYNSIVAEMGGDDSQVSITNQALPPNTIWHYIRRRVSLCGKESPDSPPCIVAIDSTGEMMGNTPNQPKDLTAERISGGKIKLRWRYTRISEQVAPTGFKIYIDSGGGFNFGSPDAIVAYGIGGIANEFSWTSEPLTHGQIYRFCVRSYKTGQGESQNTDFVSAVADSIGPDAITGLLASYKEI